MAERLAGRLVAYRAKHIRSTCLLHAPRLCEDGTIRRRVILGGLLEGVLGDVSHGLPIMIRVTNETIETLLLPKRSVASEAAMNVIGAMALPRTCEAFHGMLFERTAENMHMVGHNGVRLHLAPDILEVMQGIDERFSKFRPSQQTLPLSLIEKTLQRAQLHLLKVLPRCPFFKREPAAMPMRRLIEPPLPRQRVSPHGIDHVGRKRIVQSKGDEIAAAGHPPMRQVALIGVEVPGQRTFGIKPTKVLRQRDMLRNEPSHASRTWETDVSSQQYL